MCCVSNILNYIIRTNWSIIIENAFEWDIKTQQVILGAFYYGYFVTPILGGWLVGKYGGFYVLFIASTMSSLIALFSPFTARCGISPLVISRIFDGFAQGLGYVSTMGIIRKWAKLNERSTFVSISTSGYSAGAIVSSYVSPLLITSPIFGGWPSTFYIFGITGIIWCLCWWIVGSSDVTSNRWVSEFEKESIKESQSKGMQTTEVDRVNWKELAMSAPVLSISVFFVGIDFGLYLLSADIPIFFETILQFDIKMSGYLLSVAQFVYFIAIIFGGVVADKLINHTEISKIHIRKLFVSFLGLQSILLILIGYVHHVWIAAL
ncbi:sialin-like [Antedon mediterranea]|uniref:sialin-like n=1 Tax=Antedon mediterranea TaxID=105859 RepID=UPI003AF5C5FB